MVNAAAYKMQSSDPQMAGVVRHDRRQEQLGRSTQLTCAARVLEDYGLDPVALTGREASQAKVGPTKLVKRIKAAQLDRLCSRGRSMVGMLLSCRAMPPTTEQAQDG